MSFSVAAQLKTKRSLCLFIKLLFYFFCDIIFSVKINFKDGLTDGILNDSSSHSDVYVKITQVEFDNTAHPVTINMCNQTYQTELPYMLVHIEYSKS